MAVKPSSQVVTSKIDSTRERELFRYFQPSASETAEQRHRQLSHNTLCVDVAVSPDTTLTALAQLCAIRLNASRAMISVIGKEIQYFLAESTKSLSLLDSRKSEVEGDKLWIGCAQVGKEGRLCEKTIELDSVPGEFPCFTVTDLSTDSRFNELPFVSGAPFFKFYAGTPLTTIKGINIGSLFILDTIVRPPLNSDQQDLLGSIAQIVMKHLEVSREAEERKKAMSFSQGLNAFVEGKHRFSTEELSSTGISTSYKPSKLDDQIRYADPCSSEEGSMSEHHASISGEPNGHGELQRRSRLKTLDKIIDIRLPPSEISKSPDTPSEVKPPVYEDTSPYELEVEIAGQNSQTGYRSTFSRAANLLRESLHLQSQGGVVYFDATVCYSGRDLDKHISPTLPNHAADSQVLSEFNSLIDGKNNKSRPSLAATGHSTLNDCFEARRLQKPAEIISYSTSETHFGHQSHVQESNTFSALDESFLQSLIYKYPRGKLWQFDEDGSLSSSEEDAVAQEKIDLLNGEQAQNQRRRLIVKTLQKHFLGVRQLLFAPLWDSSRSRWFSSCFVFSTSSNQIFSAESELNFLRAFSNNVMAEVSRLASIAADRQKGDFIGSISHELRSPLHGILASAEFLSETESDAFQSSLVDTILSCGRTLLDTISHVLDFSKINTFEKNWRKAQKPEAKFRITTERRQLASQKAPPMMNVYSIVNVAALTEEVIEGVYAGQIFQDIGSSDIADLASMRGKTAEIFNYRPSMRTFGARNSVPKEVDIILDIPHDDFTFSTQPGALRRVIMNVFGNALKYTTKGTITVKLALHDAKDSIEGSKVLEIRVEDTGKGISNEYLRTSLYTPFCQEDVLATGTGLGLSIVRSIITMLHGSIDVQSQTGQGTTVTMHIPLMRASASTSVPSTPSGASLASRSFDDPLSMLQAAYPDKSVALYGFDSDIDPTTQLTKKGLVLSRYISDWFGFDITLSSTEFSSTDIIIVGEEDFPVLAGNTTTLPAIVVLRSSSSRSQKTIPYSSLTSPVEFVSKPFGPYKLAKAIRICLEKAQRLNATNSKNSPLSTQRTKKTVESEELLDLKALILDLSRGQTLAALTNNAKATAIESTKFKLKFNALSTESNEKARWGYQDQEFPFPNQFDQKPRWSAKAQASSSPTFSQRRNPALIGNDSKLSEKLSAPMLSVPEAAKQTPMLLLVDDNNINLQLLETYMRKRKYQHVDSATDGLLAVKAASCHPSGYDIIFMDISMPVMNGFEATRAIRAIEQDRGCTTPALIIALTGLASSRDQTEALASGVDIFLTKPVSFKKVGLILDEWKSNREIDTPKVDGR